MPRTKGGFTRHRRHKAVLDAVKGHRAARRTRFRAARESLIHAMRYATIHRRQRKREMRSLWIVRIKAAANANGMSYHDLIHGLKLAAVDMDRKMLADLAAREPEAFASVTETARNALAAAG